MSRHWSQEEVDLAIADYLEMLLAELRGEAYSKAEHYKRLIEVLNGRTRPAIERKHQNISAILHALDLPYIDGYKPLGNFQALLRDRLESALGNPKARERLCKCAECEVAARLPAVGPLDEILVLPDEHDHPGPGFAAAPLEWRGRRIDYLEREAANKRLGDAGEEFVVETERRRLAQAGRGGLAGKVEWVAQTRGDHLGYDVLSFDEGGEERFIEAKTTRAGRFTPFFVTHNELVVSTRHPNRYWLYRVFSFATSPRILPLNGSLEDFLSLRPHRYRAEIRRKPDALHTDR